MAVVDDAFQLDLMEIIDLYELDARAQGDPQINRWHPGTTIDGRAVVWQGLTYQPFPIESEGWEMSSSGTLPRPTLRASNIGGFLGAYLRQYNNLLGAKVTRRRTIGKYLDAVNFPGGRNPNADPNTFFPDDVFYVARKMAENPIFIEIELATSFDVEGIQLPRRQVIAGTCQWVYRSVECNYRGGPVETIDGTPTNNPALDKCRKTLAACRARFGNRGVLNTSAFPGARLQRYG